MATRLAKLWENRWRDWPSQNDAPDLKLFLSEHPEAVLSEKYEVVIIDQKFRWQTSRSFRVEEYLNQLPDLRDNPENVFQLVVGEFESRVAKVNNNAWDESIFENLMEEYSTRFSFLGDTLRSKLQEIVSESDAGKKGAHSSSPLTNSSDPHLATSSHIRPSDQRSNPLKPKEPRREQIDLSKTTVPDPESLSLITHIGRYRRMRMLGEGAFGFVWLGLDEELQRYVAIKVPRPERFRGPEDAEQYLQEARTAASLDHPNIVPVYDVGRTKSGSIYVVSKFIEGCTLVDRMKQAKLSHEEVTKLLATAARALHHAHQRRFIHRDVKPANILIEEQTGVIYVADFGLAIREEDYLRDNRMAGTPGYMSPEQVRGEGHRLDGRSDIFSLGVIMYEMLTGKRPFRGSTTNELFHQVISVDPPSPRSLDETIPVELDRICLRSLSKRAADRYSSGNELADDLSHWQQGPDVSYREHLIVPKGLRSFDADDADFFLDLLPGPRDRDGLPESIRFWKKKIQENDPDKAFRVGLIYGPSGCGKSSLVKAGLIPSLSKAVKALYIEATPDETETRILRGLHKILPDLPTDLTLIESLAWIRRRSSSGNTISDSTSTAQSVSKIVIILDQFEQWLHSHRTDQNSELITALRQCDGGQLQAIAMVRDDFAMAAARFMDMLEIPILQGVNFATVDLFDVDHAEQVLIKFGQAFGKLPANCASLSDDQKSFVSAVSSGLARDGKVVSVRLALFAEMVKGKIWTMQTLQNVGGTEGVGVNFLEETFSSRNANPTHRLHEQAARAVLKALLPEVSTDIKGHMRSHLDLQADAGYESRPGDFNTLLRILDGELRLITPTDPEGHTDSSRDTPLATRYYQLTHDYMVPSLRDWLTRKQQETRAGRAELKLAERTNLWSAKPENRYLPSIAEWGAIQFLTAKAKWTSSQQVMMRRANRLHGLRMMAAFTMAILMVCSGLWIKSQVDAGQQRTTARGLVTALLNAETRDVPKLIAGLKDYRKWTDSELKESLSSPDAKTKLHARMALLPVDTEQVVPLQVSLLEASPENVLVLRDVLNGNHHGILDSYWNTLESSTESTDRRLAAGAALARFVPKEERWSQSASPVAKLLVDENPLRLATWMEAFRPVRGLLIPELGIIFRDQSEKVSPTQRDLATNILESYAADDVDQLASLIIDARPKQFASLFNVFKAHGDVAKNKMLNVLVKTPSRPPLWDSSKVISLTEKPVSTKARQMIDSAQGHITNNFAIAQTLRLKEFVGLTELLGPSGYRPVRLRPYNSRAVKPNPSTASEIAEPFAAAIWHRDGRAWRVAIDQTIEELRARDERLRGEGFAAVDVAGYIGLRNDLPSELFAAMWIQRKEDNEESRLCLSETAEARDAAYHSLEKDGFKSPQTLQVFLGLDGTQRFNGIKQKKDVELEFESRMLDGLSTMKHRQEMQNLEKDDFIPTDASTLVRDLTEETISSSVWDRISIHTDTTIILAHQQANSAAALARLGEREKIFAALRVTDNPESLTHFVHRCRDSGVTFGELWECINAADASRQSLSGETRRIEDRVLFGLLLALGEFKLEEVPEGIQKKVIETISTWFSDDRSSAIHGVTGWLLRQWEQKEIVLRVDRTSVAYDPNREWFTIVFEAAGNRFYQTYVVIAPGEYDIGSPNGEEYRSVSERKNRVKLTRPVAILDREITRGEFEASGICKSIASVSPTTDHPMNCPSWYQCAQYCRWLTERFGLSETDQAYVDPKSLDKKQYPVDGDTGFPKNWPVDLTKRGFRLPTEAEWEIAARGGMRTSFGFGIDESLLAQYAWFTPNVNRQTQIVKQLRPNMRGLFDMHGNVFEWCHDWFLSDIGTIYRIDPTGSSSGPGRLNRGGSWISSPSSCRSASRSMSQPSNCYTSYGLRVALVPFSAEK